MYYKDKLYYDEFLVSSAMLSNQLYPAGYRMGSIPIVGCIINAGNALSI